MWIKITNSIIIILLVIVIVSLLHRINFLENKLNNQIEFNKAVVSSIEKITINQTKMLYVYNEMQIVYYNILQMKKNNRNIEEQINNASALYQECITTNNITQ